MTLPSKALFRQMWNWKTASAGIVPRAFTGAEATGNDSAGQGNIQAEAELE